MLDSGLQGGREGGREGGMRREGEKPSAASVNWQQLLRKTGLCECFNIDVKRPRIYTGPEEALFGCWLVLLGMARPIPGEETCTNASRVRPCGLRSVVRCTTYMDIVMVLDGSNSIYPWYEVQNFLSNILSKFHISPEQMQVGVLQYGEVAVHEWSLRDYQTTQEVVEAAKNISRQEGRETRTAYAIHMGCTEAFSPERGAREGATKVMIVVLGHYIRRQQDPETFISEIKYIASDPDDKYFFNVTDEAALNDIVDALGDRIFTLEGTLGYNESSFELEMSQIGFSTHVLDDGILFGMVGAYDWDGGVLKEGTEGRIMPTREAFESEFPQELKNHAAYLGYTVSSVIVGDWRRLYIGSYYGSEVCGLDVDQDGITDVLLVAAPMYLGPGNKEAGRVYIYSLNLNHDGYTDLLVGAPLEDGHIGAIYIYHGQGIHIIHNYKQRIAGSSLSPSLQYFGRSVSARLDLDGDGLLDLAVGAQGSAVLLSSRSIVQINMSLSFQPHSINIIQKTCQRGGRESACLNATACFLALSHSPGTHSNSFELSVVAMLDDRKLTARALFDDSNQRQTQLGINDTESGPVLDEGWPTTFKRSQPYVIRSPRRRLAVEVQLQNKLENAYNTSLTLHYSRNLHFSSLSIREDAQLKIECTSLSSNSHSCNVNFMLDFEFSCTSLLSKVQMKLTAASDSLQNLGCYSVSNLELRLSLPSVAAGDRVFMAVTEVFSYNNCSRSWCVEVVCETALEVLKGRAIPISLWILIGSIIGGLLLLALIIFIMWKLGFFTRKQIKDEELED
ncbi:unnamed protein product [Coregonus sp. 'balchen']|nr:unnamed protein product [Coregonus sp. 'balchen']